MLRRKSISPQILEAAQHFDMESFANAVKSKFLHFPDPKRERQRILYPTWYLMLIILCGFFCGCNAIEEIAEYALLQKDWFASLFSISLLILSYGTPWWFLTKTLPGSLKRYLNKWFLKTLQQLVVESVINVIYTKICADPENVQIPLL